jgi:hypothetical protein
MPNGTRRTTAVLEFSAAGGPPAGVPIRNYCQHGLDTLLGNTNTPSSPTVPAATCPTVDTSGLDILQLSCCDHNDGETYGHLEKLR